MTFWPLLTLFCLILGSEAIINVHHILQNMHEKNLALVKNMNQICPGPSRTEDAHQRRKRQVAPNMVLEETGDLAGKVEWSRVGVNES